jgi:NitT/TauT family transport system substrate-binding protein
MSSDTVFAAKKLIQQKPDAVRRFVAAWLESARFMRQDKADTIKVARKMTGFDEEVLAREYDQSIAIFTDDCRFDAQSLATLKRSFADLKVPDLGTTYTEEFVPAR